MKLLLGISPPGLFPSGLLPSGLLTSWTADSRSAILGAAVLLLLAPVSVSMAQTPAQRPATHAHLDGETLPEDTDLPASPEHHVACENGMANGFPCLNVDLLEVFSPAQLGASAGNDLWGWTDPVTGTEYALMGLNNGTAFVDLSVPDDGVLIGTLPTHTSNSSWRDIKVYADHAFIVSEAGGHGMQIFDLKNLRNVASPPVVFSNTAHFDGFGSAHNIVINEESGFAYAVGAATCNGGLHMIDIQDPVQPVDAGCFSADGYTHDAQCVIYQGPDVEHQGDEICFGSNTDTLTIVDVTDKNNPLQLSRNSYSGSGYTHQGWLTEDHVYHLLDDEVDELSFGHNTKTYIWDVSDLEAPTMVPFTSSSTASDHNQYVRGNYTYQANYRAGLRIFDISDIANGNMQEVAFFDVVPGSDASGTSGAWSVYPFFESGVVLVSSTQGGLFVLWPNLCTNPAEPSALAAMAAGDNQIDLSWAAGEPGGTFNVYRSFGACPGGQRQLVASDLVGTTFSDSVSGGVAYAYEVSQSDDSGLCESAPSACASATTTGTCNAPPIFAGLDTITNLGEPTCALELSWTAATANCGGSVTYNVYRGDGPGFVPSEANRIAADLVATTFTDSTVDRTEDYYYAVRATDLGSGTEDSNLQVLVGTPTGPISDGAWNSGAELTDPSVIYSTGATFTDPTSKHIGWEPSDARVHSGSRSYFSTYADGQCISVGTPPIELTPSQSPRLSFWTAYEIESGYDGGVVEITMDGGGKWTRIDLDQGYPGSFIQSSDACGFATGSPSFTGTNLSFNEFTADLSAYAGETVQLRWIFSTDGGLTLEGWYLDDIEITHAQVSASCFAGLFYDGFEGGTAGGWSATSP